MAMGDSFVSGFSAMTDARERKKKRQQDAAEAAAERSLRLEQQTRENANRKALQDAELTFRGSLSAEERLARAVEADKDRQFRSGEGDKERGFRRGERIDSQGFASTQSELERAARVLAQDKELKARTDMHSLELPLKGASLGLQARAQEWAESPNNPLNDFRAIAARRQAQDLNDTDGVNGFMINGGAPSAITGNPGQVNGGRPQFDKSAEGRIVIGPDGKRYVIKNGWPVLAP